MSRRVQLSAVIGLLAGIFTSPSETIAGNVTLAWNRNPEPSVSYVIAYGTQPGNPTSSNDVGTALTGTVSNLVEGQRYYFVVYAYVMAAISAASNEVNVVVAATTPIPIQTP